MKTYLLILISAIFIVFFHYQSLPHASSCVSLPLQEATQDNREMVQFSEKKIDVKQDSQKTVQTNLEKSDIKEKILLLQNPKKHLNKKKVPHNQKYHHQPNHFKIKHLTQQSSHHISSIL